MANQLHFKKIAQIPGAVHVPLSETYHVLAPRFTVSTFWYHLRNAIDVCRINGHVTIPGDDVETFTTILRLYFEHNGVYAVLDDEAKDVSLIIHSHSTKYKMVETGPVAGGYTMQPITPWLLSIRDIE